ncbi:hypothetical protein BDW75DRAFT_212366 [Aspergillus navahoensis]
MPALATRARKMRFWARLTDTLSMHENCWNGGHTSSFWLEVYRKGKPILSVVAILVLILAPSTETALNATVIMAIGMQMWRRQRDSNFIPPSELLTEAVSA